MHLLRDVLLPLGVLGGGLATAMALNSMGTSADQAPPTFEPVRVDVMNVQPTDYPAEIQATGVVEAFERVVLMPQVTGEVVWSHAALKPGARFPKGTLLARIEDADYKLQVTQAQAQVESARTDLQLEKARGQQAQREWELLGRTETNPLALREPQQAAARAALASAEANLKTAELNLSRTRLRTPFDATVLSDDLSLGQVVSPTTSVATLQSNDLFRVVVAVPVRDLQWIDWEGEDASSATITQALGNASSISAEGRVAELGGELDPATRTAQVYVEVPNPLDQADGSIPILPGAYVDIAIHGRTVSDVVKLPRKALLEGRFVYTVGSDDTLASRDVQVLWGTPDDVFVYGLAEGDRVITTSLSLPILGMPLAPQATAAAL